MAREGTRSATGNSRPRVFPTIPEPVAAAPKKRATANTGAKRGPKKAPATKASKPVGVTKKAPAKKTATATKAKAVVKKAEGAASSTAKKAAPAKKGKGAESAKKTAGAKKK